MEINVQAQDPDSVPPIHLPPNLRIAFIHPDLGLGGAERLVVDAAVALQKRGHEVEVFTSYHEDGAKGRSFDETRNGTLTVHVLGNSIFPRSILGRFTIICAMLRQLHLVFSFLLAASLYHASSWPLLSLFALPVETPFRSSSDWSPRRQLEPFDVIVIDQLSTGIPLLRWFGGNRVVFYCHFPDQLLSPSSSAALSSPHDSRAGTPFSIAAEVRKTYRAPIDALEQATTGEADKILVNSDFTAQVFERTFPALRRQPRVVYPSVDLQQYGNEVEKVEEQDRWLVSDKPMLLSINRFEGKKDLSLAVDAFAKVRAAGSHPGLRLICAGGYDPRLGDNVRTLSNLQQLVGKLGLSQHAYSASALPDVPSPVPARSRPTISPSPPPADASPPDVLFLLNISAAQKSLLLSPSQSGAVALLYTPMFEHFGIVPLEGMASGLPVLATTTGGPTETVVDRGLPSAADEADGAWTETTGLLRPRDPVAWSEALSALLALSPAQRAQLGRTGKERVRSFFSQERLGEDFERACVDAAKKGWPIVSEVGFKKMCMFFGIMAVCFVASVAAVVV
ncbi:GDP-Man:Man(1)GlcNAc(2)-PP-dolichol alpha-1,3-mannosyltransferase [Rhodotorula paludigena]|uniref:GDP-Man:Man(1)GlcNAc(2)-PP-dolichol alpha-1,3-mannosyltransferase n=1 Tax=Rhodotorula paludigena TaxID=86838 RepID=UPI0031762CDE